MSDSDSEDGEDEEHSGEEEDEPIDPGEENAEKEIEGDFE